MQICTPCQPTQKTQSMSKNYIDIKTRIRNVCKKLLEANKANVVILAGEIKYQVN